MCLCTFYSCISECLYMSVCHKHTGACGSQRGHQFPWATRCGGRELNSGSAEEQQELLTFEPALWLLHTQTF